MGTLPLITGIVLSLTGLFYAGLITMFTYGWYRRQRNIKTKALSPGIKVSVIIAARNEENRIAELLTDLVSQDYPAELTEVIIVDDRSSDGTAKLVTDFISSRKLLRFFLVNNEEHTGKYTVALALKDSPQVYHKTGNLP